MLVAAPGTPAARRAACRDHIAAITGAAIVTARCLDCGGDHGEPIVSAERPAWASVSHAESNGEWMSAIAVSFDAPIGVDLELREQPPERLAAIREVTGYAGEYPLAHWTRVEAVLKADGRGLRVDPSLVRVDGGVAHLEGRTYDVATEARGDWLISVARETPATAH